MHMVSKSYSLQMSTNCVAAAAHVGQMKLLKTESESYANSNSKLFVSARETDVRVFIVQTDVRFGGPHVTAAQTSVSDSEQCK